MEKSEATNIVKIVASSKTNERRVSTGVKGFNDFVEGGFPRGSMILLAGSAG
jgi:predicted ATP-dependent serine protease